MSAAPDIRAQRRAETIAAWLGREIGTRVVVAAWRDPRDQIVVRVRCECGRERIARPDAVAHARCRCAGGGRRLTAEQVTARLLGQRVGSRVVAEIVEVGRDSGEWIAAAIVECDCGRRDRLRVRGLRDLAAGGCPSCAAAGMRVHVTSAALDERVVGDVETLRMLHDAGERAPEVWREQCACREGDRCETCEAQIEACAELVAAIGRPLSLVEVGALFGVTRERARQLEARGLAWLRRVWREGEALAADVGRPAGSWDAWSAGGELAAGGG